MPEGFGLLWRLNLNDLEDAVNRWRTLSEEMKDAHTNHQSQVTGPLRKSKWEGESATSGFMFLSSVEDRLVIARIETQAISVVLSKVHNELGSAQRRLRNVVREAEAHGYSVDDNGLVSPPKAVEHLNANDPDSQAELQKYSSQLGGYREEIQKVLEQAKEADHKGEWALSRVQGDALAAHKPHALNEAYVRTRAAMQIMGVQEPRPPGNDAKAAAKWWAGLSQEQQRDYVLFYPDLIGKTNGLPAAIRDDANRIFLSERLDDPDFVTAHQHGISSTAILDSRYHNLRVLQDVLDRHATDDADKKLYLLGFNSHTNGQAVIAMGNPDAAAHTGILVPGTGTTMDKVAGQLNRLDLLQEVASGRSANGKVAMVFWLGYNAPTLDPSVTLPNRAVNGAEDLQKFVLGTRAAHDGGSNHVTVIGHSYGSTVVGEAARRGDGLGADDIVAVGSPGMGSHTVNARQFHIDPSHVYVGRSPNDPIPKYFSDLTLGMDPMHPMFGAQRIVVDPGDHGSYFNQGSAGLSNLGAIIAGQKPNLQNG